MKLSIVTTLYKSESYIEEFCERVEAVAQKITNNYEIIIVNDGSPDNSLLVALTIKKKNEKIKVIDLSRNFGHHRAILIGLEYSKGDFIFFLDSDLEEEPEWIFDFWNVLQANPDTDSAYGYQVQRKGQFLERFLGYVFYSVFNFLSDIKIKPNLINARLMTRKYVNALNSLKEREIFLAGLWEYVGFKQIAVPIVKKDKGESSYTIQKRLSLMVNAITSFSAKPLYYIFYLGSLVAVSSVCILIYLLLRKFFFGYVLVGWVSLMISIWLLIGIALIGIGVIGIYLGKIFNEVKDRPTIIRKIYE